jgi:serine phosphatase RsbU (regulator of sigma subunit)/pSer/pThr/pTyr-binding forkhead associated (FHA) protein
MASLHILKGPNAGQRIPLNKPVTILGRESKDCDVTIPNQAVSRVHAQINQVDGQYFIEDLRSRNHTYLNNKQVEGRMPLRDNDRIKICDSMFTFHSAQDNLPPLPADIRRAEQSDEDIELPSTVQATLARMPQQQLLDAAPAERLRALLEISNQLASASTQEEQLDKIAEILFQTFRQADRCFIILRDEQNDILAVRVFRSRRPTEETPRFSRTIVRQCMEQQQAFLVEDASTDSKFSLAQSITDFRIRSVMIAPLVADQNAFGVIQLDTQDRSKRFTQEDLKLLSSVANQASVALDNVRLYQDQARRERLMRDMEIAEQVQRSFLPQHLPSVAGYEFYAHYKSAMTIGGDYYDFVQLPDGRWVIMLGDVAGKGVPAALLMAKLSAEARFHILTQPTAVDAVLMLNSFLLQAGLSDRFITLAVAVLDPKKNSVELINAGHVAPMVYRRETEDLADAIDVDHSGFPLGVDPQAQYESVEVALNMGDALLLFTDGVTDALNPEGKQFRIDGVKRMLASDSAITDPIAPGRVGKRVIDGVRAHIAGRDQYDDIALVSFGRWDGVPASGPITRVGMSTSDSTPIKSK